MSEDAMDMRTRDDLQRAAQAMLTRELSSDAFQWAIAQAEPALTSLDDAGLRRKLTGFESRLELARLTLEDPEAMAECARVARELLTILASGQPRP